MIFEMLTGTPLFAAPNPADVRRLHLSAPPPPLAARRDGLPPALDAVIQRAMAKDPKDRYGDAAVLLADYRRALRSAWPPPLGSLPDTETELAEPVNPYKGLNAFGEADAEDFFGRETLVQQLLARLGEGGELARFLAIVGPSGSGKSSVVRAGLLPALRRGGLVDSERWFIVEFRPGAHPFEALEAALQRVAVSSPKGLFSASGHGDRSLAHAISQALPREPAGSGGEQVEVVLVIDQFEEVFTLVEAEAERARFLNNLVAVVLEEGSRIRVVITLRADFIDRPLRYVDFGELVQQRSELVLPLTPEETERAVTGPARRAGLEVEAGLTAAIVRDVSDQPGALPLLQYALTELFEEREGRTLTQAAYRAIGGVLGSLGRRAEAVYARLAAAEQAAAQHLFLRLVTLGEGIEDTRRRVLRAELQQLTVTSGPRRDENGLPSSRADGLAPVIEVFGLHRLLSFDRDPLTREPTLEVAHEALLREWPRLRTWLDENRAAVRMQRRLAAGAAEWQGAGGESSFLLTGAQLEQFEGWAEASQVALTPVERTFLEASIAGREQQQADELSRHRRELSLQKRAATSLRYLVGALSLFLLVAAGLTAYAFSQRNSAQTNFLAAERIRLAAQAQIALDQGEGGDVPALLALRSLQLGYSSEADAALLNALTRGFTRQVFAGHADLLFDVDFSPDGRFIVTGSGDGTARLWDSQTGQELSQFTPPIRIVTVTDFSPDGRHVLVGGPGPAARLWDTQTGQTVGELSGHLGGVWAGDVSPDGRYALTADDESARLWDIWAGQEVRTFSVPVAVSVDFSPDGRVIATAGWDGAAQVWEAATGRSLFQIMLANQAVCVVFSPDGRYLLVLSGSTAYVWDWQAGVEVSRYTGHTDWLVWGDISLNETN